MLKNKQFHVNVLLRKLHLKGDTYRILLKDSKVRATLYSIINSTIGKYWQRGFYLDGHTTGIFHSLKKIRTTLYSIINITMTGKYNCSVAFM